MLPPAGAPDAAGHERFDAVFEARDSVSLEIVCRQPLEEHTRLRVVYGREPDGRQRFIESCPRFLRVESDGASARFVYWLSGRAQRE